MLQGPRYRSFCCCMGCYQTTSVENDLNLSLRENGGGRVPAPLPQRGNYHHLYPRVRWCCGRGDKPEVVTWATVAAPLSASLSEHAPTEQSTSYSLIFLGLPFATNAWRSHGIEKLTDGTVSLWRRPKSPTKVIKKSFVRYTLTLVSHPLVLITYQRNHEKLQNVYRVCCLFTVYSKLFCKQLHNALKPPSHCSFYLEIFKWGFSILQCSENGGKLLNMTCWPFRSVGTLCSSNHGVLQLCFSCLDVTCLQGASAQQSSS